MIVCLFKGFRKIQFGITRLLYTPVAKILLYLNGASFGTGMNAAGLLKIEVTRRGKLKIGNNFHVNSGDNFNLIGRQQKTIFWVEGELKIGNNVGLSATAIICNQEIIIGDNVTIGGNTVIYDTDFHSLNAEIRKNKTEDKKSALKSPVIIEDNVFIGAHSTILKGVRIGKNAVIGACSVVTKSVPENEIWAGNPAKLIRKNFL